MTEQSPFAGTKSQLETIPNGVPVVFISYSWDNEQHKDWVLNLSKDLRERYRVYTFLDRYNCGGDDLITFMRKGLQRADRVLIIGTPRYMEKLENSKSGGAKFEDQIITLSLYQEMDSQKFIPILREGSFSESFNLLIGNRVGYNLSDDGRYEEELQALAADLWGHPMNQAPALGPKPNFVPASQVLQPAKPESPQDFATLVKMYLPNPNSRIILDDLIEKEADSAYKKIIQSADYRVSLTSNVFNRFNEIHQEAISNLIQTVVPIVRYGSIVQASLLVDAMVKLCKKPFINGEIYSEDTVKLHFMAATYLFHAMGTVCVRYNRFDLVHLLVSSKVNPPHAYSSSYSYSLQYLAGCNHFDASELNQLRGTNWTYPYSFMVLSGIRVALADVFLTDEEFKDTYFAWEHLASLLCRYHKNCMLQADWNPIGHFLYKRVSLLRQIEDSYTDFFKAAEKMKDEWSPIKQGLFAGSYDNYLNTYNESEAFFKLCFRY